MTANAASRCFDHSFHLNGWGEVDWTTKYFDALLTSSPRGRVTSALESTSAQAPGNFSGSKRLPLGHTFTSVGPKNIKTRSESSWNAVGFLSSILSISA